MSFSLAQILLFIVAYLTGLFTVAYLADRGIIPERITRHPATYVLSLGVFAGAMATNGALELAYSYGYSFLLYYGGVVFMFIFAALLLLPLLRLCRVYQLASLADVLTFRFRSPRIGAIITIAMCLTLLPLLALQIQAVADSIQIMAGDAGNLFAQENRQDGLALLFCIIITVFSMLFGTRHNSAQERNTGLVTAIAFESLVKLAAMFVLLLAAVYGVFGGFDGVEQWLHQNPQLGNTLNHSLHDNTARTLLVLFFAGAVCMPHIFHMAFAENTDSRDLRTATWGLPLYLMLLSLPILPLTWAGIKLGHQLPIDYSGLALGLEMHSTAVSAAAFVAGLSAASATIIITTLALANMCLNHLILPSRLSQIDPERNIYAQLKWLRRTLIGTLIVAGYMFFIALNGTQSLTQLGLVAFSGTLQFLPGVIATPYWPGANRKGLMAGLATGLTFWFFSMLLPLASNFALPIPDLLGDGNTHWSDAILISLSLNTGMFILVSLLTSTSADERIAAEICSMDDTSRPVRRVLSVRTASEFSAQLSKALGEKTARVEVNRALAELQFSPDEARPYALRRLRARVRANLSGLLGPAVAHSIIERCIPFQQGIQDSTEDIHLIERKLDRVQTKFTGLTADLDNLRRHYRETLHNLPIGVCSIGDDGEILLWNRSMEKITGIAPRDVIGSLLGSLPLPWYQIIGDFQQGDSHSQLKTEVVGNGPPCWISLHKTIAGTDTEVRPTDTVILVEDITELELLEKELLHNERLASIGRLAAGVAHEIGNPVTGIACLAQNLEYESDPQEIRFTAVDILKQTERINRIVESLVNFSHAGSRSGEVNLEPCNLADCVDESIHLLGLDRKARPVEFRNQCDRELVVLADSQRLLQVFVNLLGNARDACDSDGQVDILAKCRGGDVVIDIQDNGCGIPPDMQAHVFEPFVTTKDPGAGTGLGLSLVFSILDDMGGSVSLSSPLFEGPHPGTRVTVQLPRSSYGDAFEA
ncbi:MAG: PAS domain-containing protein [Pseudomonadales bacterium]|nr:PAS domain-containing protein [Halioglobus sp.]MCP5130382.1 PAS domain-containing protein [Pseudomonadales bacterium]